MTFTPAYLLENGYLDDEIIMDIEEEYNCPNDYNYEGTCLIFSKVIDSKYPMEKWNNRFLNLNRIIEQEIVGDLEYKKKKKER